MCANHNDLAAAVEAGAQSWASPRGSTEVREVSHTERRITVLGPKYVGGGALAHRLKVIAVPDVVAAVRMVLKERGYRFTTDPDQVRNP